jgi:heme ABC exporter ATP-binding subunit CcmA
MISTSSLRVVFHRTVALHDLDLSIGPGVTGLFGQNGSGKTTLLRVLAGLLRPSSGSVALEGVAPSRAPEELRRSIGYVGHRSGLYGRLTIVENLQLFARLYDVVDERIDEVVTTLGLGGRADSRVSDLSSGWKRRAAVARAILHEPRFLFLDEPYANLDDDASALVSRAVAGWNSAERVALVATHGAKRVKPYAVAGIILRDGRIVTEGSYAGAER